MKMKPQAKLTPVRDAELVQAIILNAIDAIRQAHLQITGSDEVDAADSMNALVMLLGSIVERYPPSNTAEGLEQISEAIRVRLVDSVRQGRILREGGLESSSRN